jgi:hypothetical protein
MYINLQEWRSSSNNNNSSSSSNSSSGGGSSSSSSSSGGGGGSSSSSAGNSMNKLWTKVDMRSCTKLKEFLFVFIYLFLFSWGEVRLSPLGTSATVGLLYQLRMTDEYGMRIDRENRHTRRKPAPMPLCPPQIPHDLTRDRTRAVAVESWQLIAWAMTRLREVYPCYIKSYLALRLADLRISGLTPRWLES